MFRTVKSGLRPDVENIGPNIAFIALPGVSFVLGSMSNFEPISSRDPDCSKSARAGAEAACSPSYVLLRPVFNAIL